MSVSIAAIAAITVVYFEFLPVNPTTAALTYVVVVLVIATGWGIVEATSASLLAVACFNFFFLPPVGTWTIADPQNWVALGADDHSDRREPARPRTTAQARCTRTTA